MRIGDGVKLGIGGLIVAFGLSIFIQLCNDGNFFSTTKFSTWPKSAEFYQLSTGQDRFSEHSTNFKTMTVVVDHQTGVEYLRTPDGICPLLDVDGEPLREAEAGADE